ncbi:MAG TPA: CoA transferase [Acidimicrobiales bacterium]|jgi:crotonobetainyl-CoA:carnitine CoA-transferase CaiB-like acyl-CoA transferase
MGGALEGLRVLDLTWGTAGPMTTMFLADNGADVIRVEPPAGDPFAGQTGYRVWNRGKRSAVLDLKADEGRREFLALAAQSDVVIDSFSPGTTARLGIDPEALAGVNPRLITCSITGYGEHPAHRDRPGYDALVAARTGLLFDQKGRRGTAMEFICGRPGPEPEFDAPEGLVRGADRDGPVFPRTQWPSVGATYVATLGIMAALRARAVTGQGQRVTTSLLQGALAAACLNWQRVEHPDAPLYWMWPVDSRSIEGLYPCADGRWVHHWTVRPRFVLAAAEKDSLESTELDLSYRDDPDRISMEPDGLLTGIFLHPLLTEAFAKFPSEDWIRAGEEAGMGVAAVRSPADALADKSFLADGCVAEVDDPEEGPIRHAGVLLEFSATPGAIAGPAPRPGQHTDEVRALAAAADAAPDQAPDPARRELSHALEGVRVLDLGLGVAGPFTGRALADLGAEVIKVNALYDGYWNGTHMGLGTNRGKRSIALNLKNPAGREALERLVATADVVTLNWRPGAAARLGLDYETLRARYPQLVYCNTRGYEKGPRSDLPGTDQTAAALTGTEWEDGACDAGNPPLWSRSNMGDTGNALLAAIAIAMALYHRERTGEGQAVSTSIVNAGLLHTSYAYIRADGSPADWGHVDAGQYGLSPYYRLYRCAPGDEWVFVAAVTSEQRSKLRDLLPGAPADDGDDALAAWLASYFGGSTAAEAFRALDDAGVPVELVDEGFCRDLFDDPDAKRLGLVSETRAASVGRFEDPGLLVEISPAAGLVQRGPCACGEHTGAILGELGYSDAEVAALLEGKAALQATDAGA